MRTEIMEISRISRKAEKPGYVRESPPEELLELQDQSTDLFLIYGGQPDGVEEDDSFCG